MRLYFTDGKKKIGFDTVKEVWTDENDKEFMKDENHRFIQVYDLDLDYIKSEINFNMYGYSKKLKSIDEETETPLF